MTRWRPSLVRSVAATWAALCVCAAPGTASAQSVDEQLPVAAFLDSAGLHAALLQAPRTPTWAPRRLLFVARYDSTGALKNVTPLLGPSIPRPYADSLTALLRPHVRTRIDGGRATRQYVWLRMGKTPQIAVPREEATGELTSAPELLNQYAVGGHLKRAVRRLVEARPELVGYQTTGIIQFQIDESGIPHHAEMVRGTEDLELIAAMIGVVESMRFRPATSDDVPVAVRVELPIFFEFKR